jgi:DegV family protein with EDD domain
LKDNALFRAFGTSRRRLDQHEGEIMAAVRIVADSSCDIPEEMADQLGIMIVPLSVRFGDEELLDRKELSTDEFWLRCKASSRLPETAAPSPGAFQEAFLRVEPGDSVVCLTLSGKLSATYQSAQLAADGVADRVAVRLVDTNSVTVGQGVVVLAAAEAAAGGASLDDVVALAESVMLRTRSYGIVDTLDHLEKGGRIGGAKALIGSLLSIKPVIVIRNGVVEEESKQRTRSRSIRYLAEKVRAAGPLDRLAVAHGAAPDIGDLLDLLSDIHPVHNIITVDLGPVVGTHAGPGTIGIAFVTATE